MGKGVKSGTIIGIMFAIVFVIALGSAIISRLNMNNYLEDGPPEEAAETEGVTRLPVRVDGSEDRAAYMNALAYWRDGGKFAMPTTRLINPAGEIVGVTSGARNDRTGDEPLDVKSTKPGDVKTHWAKEEAAEFLKAVAAEA